MRTRQAPKEAVTLAEAWEFAEALRNRLPPKDWYFMGSFRRRMQLRDRTIPIGDHDILVVRRTGSLRGFALPPFFDPDMANGEHKAMGHLRLGRHVMRADFYCCLPKHVGGHLLYGTGPAGLGIHMRALAKAKGWKLNQRGLFAANGRLLEGATEERIFELLDMPHLSPEQREAWAMPDPASALRFTVKSRTGGKPHHILLDRVTGQASCDCPHYTYRRTDCWAITKKKEERMAAA